MTVYISDDLREAWAAGDSIERAWNEWLSRALVENVERLFRTEGRTQMANQPADNFRTFLAIGGDSEWYTAKEREYPEMLAYLRGLVAGFKAFAHWKSGVQYVGTCGGLLRDAVTIVMAEDDRLDDWPDNPAKWRRLADGPPPEATAAWITDGRTVQLAYAEPLAAGGLSNRDTWENFDNNMIWWIQADVPPPPVLTAEEVSRETSETD